ncbi:MAG: 30S ribosomal protein S14 [Gammaproteobacteria bacterium]|nr:30S ribosomal protein S14 [Gammaproteobacteria bacterium]
MARTSVIERQLKREKLVAKYKEKRLKLKLILRDLTLTPEERMSAEAKFQKLPRDSSPVRLRNRCAETGRGRGYYRKFGLSRTKVREAGMRGEIPGLVKASW